MKMRIIFEFLLSILAYVASISSPRTHLHVRPGRHVCLLETVKSRPIPGTEIYKKAVYTPKRRNCQASASCPQFDVTYVTATKRVYHVQKSGSFTQECCPGWTTGHKRKKGCMEPICESGCGAQGRCVQPGVCRCPTGFHGENCDTDIDECMSRDHGCQHYCTNTAGSFLCVCKDGFALAEDGTTCTYCFTCSKEYVDMQTELRKIHHELKLSRVLCRSANFETSKLKYSVSRMTTQVVQLEQGLYNNTEKIVDLEKGFIETAEQLNETSAIIWGAYLPSNDSEVPMSTSNEPIFSISTDKPDDSVPTTKGSSLNHPNKTASPETNEKTQTITSEKRSFESSGFPKLPNKSTAASPTQLGPQTMPLFLYERFISLSQQIGLLEERIGMCTCSDSGERPQPRD